MGMLAYAPQDACGAQRTTCGSWFTPQSETRGSNSGPQAFDLSLQRHLTGSGLSFIQTKICPEDLYPLHFTPFPPGAPLASVNIDPGSLRPLSQTEHS